MARILCYLGLHSWRRLLDALGDCGMGAEWFECWECRRCRTTHDRVRSGKKGWSPLTLTDLRPRWVSKPIETFFDKIECPDCGCTEWHELQDGGHDSLMECSECKSRFGVNWGPLQSIERISRSRP